MRYKQAIKLLVALMFGVLVGALGAWAMQSALAHMKWHNQRESLRGFAHVLIEDYAFEEEYRFPSRAEMLSNSRARPFISQIVYLPPAQGEAVVYDKKGRRFVGWTYEKDPETDERAFLMTNWSVQFARDDQVNWVNQVILPE